MSVSQAVAPNGQLRMSELISAMSYALDLGENRRAGHAARTCVLAMSMADQLGLSQEDRSALYYASLLKDAGIAGHAMLPGRGARGAAVAARLPVPAGTPLAIASADARFDGGGVDGAARGERIPLLGRIIRVSEQLELALSAGDTPAALTHIRARAGGELDPRVVDAAEAAIRGGVWQNILDGNVRRMVTRLEPVDRVVVADERQLDSVAEGFARVIDAYSPGTARHSRRVAEYAVAIGAALGGTDRQLRQLRRAGLLHDIGKLGIPRSILEKAGKLTDSEFAEVRLHTAYTRAILWRVGAFREIAELAASHHERMDGKGYHRGLTEEQLSPLARALATADQYEALTSSRPYRPAMSDADAMAIIDKEAGRNLCPQAVRALRCVVAANEVAAPAA